MERSTREGAAPRCPTCDTGPAEGESRCRICGARLAIRPGPGSGRPAWRSGLTWVGRAYRTWSLGVFVAATIHLAWLGGVASSFLMFLILAPFGMALMVSYIRRDATPAWVVGFLILVDLGVIIAPIPWIFPRLHFFPFLPPVESRILSWYVVVYLLLHVVVAPPIAFTRSLHTAWRGGRPTLAPWICCFGMATWCLIVFILVMLVLKA